MTTTTDKENPKPTASGDDKTIVRDYFNSTGFDRWRRIYGDGEVNSVQLDIRRGHQQTVDTLLDWFKADNNLKGLTVCDAGCGVGSLSIPLAESGAVVAASDISQKMVEEAQERAKATLKQGENPAFSVQDLEAIGGNYHTVVCLDVLIHYPTDKAAEMIKHLLSLAESRIILSFAPKTLGLVLLKKIGEFFPGPSKTTRAYQHKEQEIFKILAQEGWMVQRQAMTSTRFYFSQMIEAVKVAPGTEIKIPSSDLEPALGWSPYAERLNGRFAMVGLVVLVIMELITREDFFTWLGLR